MDPTYLGVMKARGELERIGHGVYRFPQVPVTERTPFIEAVLWVGKEAALSHDAVLALHGLAFANPSVIRVVTPHRVRRKRPASTPVKIIRRALPAAELTQYFNIPSTTVARALVDCRSLIMPSRLLDAAKAARDEGLLRSAEYEELLNQLDLADG
jgi:predicted transcriptional regulator of viral defense system